MKINTILLMAAFTVVATTNAQDIVVTGFGRVTSRPPLLSVNGMSINNENSGQRRDFKDLKSKEVSVEVPASKASDIYIENTQRSIQIKTWDQPKVKVVTTVFYEGDGTKVSDEE